ncbi:hypothetical protein [Neobacillus sp. LXY-4]
MSKKNNFLTPEQVMRKKKRNQRLLYTSFIAMTIVISALVTVLANSTL